jgi:hypothetical protein
MAGNVEIVAHLAVGVLWGAILCGLGYGALRATLAASRSRSAGGAGAALLICMIFIVAVLITLSIADIFHILDWIVSLRRRNG